MKNNSLVEKIQEMHNGIKALDFENSLNANLQEWNNQNKEDFKFGVDEIISLVDLIFEQNTLESYPFAIKNGLHQNLTTLFQRLQQFQSNGNQNLFNSALQQIDAFRLLLRNWGIRNDALYSFNINDKIQSFDAEYQSVISKRNEIEQLKSNVNSLIEPAVAGSLSNSFTSRQDKIKVNRIVWMIITILSAIAGIWITIWVVESLIEVLNFDFPDGATSQQIQQIIDLQPKNSIIHVLRIAILIPVYALFIYSFKQYSKERNLEEEYAHRAAVATSLPNYGKLAGDNIVKDQIISSASNVVFSSPIERKNKTRKDDVNGTLIEAQKLVETLSKAVKSNS